MHFCFECSHEFPCKMAHSPTPDCAHSNDNFKRAQTILISFLIMWAFLLILGVGLGGKQALFHNYSTFFYVALGVRVVACILGIWGALKQHRSVTLEKLSVTVMGLKFVSYTLAGELWKLTSCWKFCGWLQISLSLASSHTITL